MAVKILMRWCRFTAKKQKIKKILQVCLLFGLTVSKLLQFYINILQLVFISKS